VDDAVQLLPQGSRDSKFQQIREMIEATAILTEDSTQAEKETEFLETWDWGIPAALMHFSLKDCDFLTIEEVEDLQQQKAASCPSPSLYQRNSRLQSHALPNALSKNDLLKFMARRRTIRQSLPQPVTIQQLSDCLFAGLGITGETKNCVCTLPLSMTPSGGARNPYEAYVYARDVEGLAPGFYHYSAMEHSLGILPTSARPDPSQLLAGQLWSDDKPCIVFLVAMLERSMWKYVDPNAYRGVLIEAGHIGQNIMLSATDHNLSACPTAAFCHSLLHQCLDIDGATHCAMYALTLGAPDKDETYKLYQQ
jgi:SagB-type dehydrogenase family enzyme